jgi:hypothetical protein
MVPGDELVKANEYAAIMALCRLELQVPVNEQQILDIDRQLQQLNEQRQRQHSHSTL